LKYGVDFPNISERQPVAIYVYSTDGFEAFLLGIKKFLLTDQIHRWFRNTKAKFLVILAPEIETFKGVTAPYFKTHQSIK
jgi:hypothetical protein